MARRDIAGLLLFHKGPGQSSNGALQRVRYLYNAAKAGHGGTLDPFATGLLPIFFGDGTKFSHYFLDGAKSYRVRVAFGQETDSQDCTGQLTHSAPVPDLAAVDWPAVLAHFTGEISQQPPAYSALKINGRRGYQLARAGEAVDFAPRTVAIDRLELLAQGEDWVELAVDCSKGTYIRSLAQDLGRHLGSAAHAAALERTAVAGLHTVNLDLPALESIELPARDALLLPLERCVAALEPYQVPEEKFRFIANGNDLRITCGGGTKVNEMPDGHKYLDALDRTERFELTTDGRLKIYYNEGLDYLLFRAAPELIATPPPAALLGRWTLATHGRGLLGPVKYPRGQHVLTFLADGRLEVEGLQFFFSKSDDLRYVFCPWGEPKISIGGRHYDYRLEGDQLQLAYKPELDGATYLFEKMR